MPRSSANPSHALTPDLRAQCEEVQQSFGRRVRELRAKRGFSIEELAHRSGLDASYVGQLERGTRNLSLFNIWRLAKGLRSDPASLLKGLPDPKATGQTTGESTD